MRTSSWLIGIIFIFLPLAAPAAEPSDETVSRCFFVYAPIFEAGKDLQNQLIFIYGQKRIAWAGGYVQAKQKNLSFKRVFENNLPENKKNGLALKNRLTKAIKSADVNEYLAVMSIARQCDQRLGLPSNDIPLP